MLIVDSSVWIGHLRGILSRPVTLLRSMDNLADVGIGDLILLEVLRGARDEAHAARLEHELRQFQVLNMLDDALAAIAARHYRALRSRGVTIRKTADLIIGTYCIEHGHALLHDDRDFEPMREHLGLIVA